MIPSNLTDEEVKEIAMFYKIMVIAYTHLHREKLLSHNEEELLSVANERVFKILKRYGIESILSKEDTWPDIRPYWCEEVVDSML